MITFFLHLFAIYIFRGFQFLNLPRILFLTHLVFYWHLNLWAFEIKFLLLSCCLRPSAFQLLNFLSSLLFFYTLFLLVLEIYPFFPFTFALMGFTEEEKNGCKLIFNQKCLLVILKSKIQIALLKIHQLYLLSDRILNSSTKYFCCSYDLNLAYLFSLLLTPSLSYLLCSLFQPYWPVCSLLNVPTTL